MTKKAKTKIFIMVLTFLVLYINLTARNHFQKTSDGGFVVVGYSDNYTYKNTNICIAKLTSNLDVQWWKSLGGLGDENGTAIRETSDGGYIVIGTTESYLHAEHDPADMLVYKLDANGNKQWRRNYGGIEGESGFDVLQTADGGFILCGGSYSHTHGGLDCLIYKLNAAGQKQWRKNYGGNDHDIAYSIVGTTDSGYIFAGKSDSYTHGEDDFLVYKITSEGKKQWRKNYGGSQNECSRTIIQTSSGDYLVAGFSSTYGSSGNSDFLVYRLDGSGSKKWRKNYGGDFDESCWSVCETSDGNFILTGSGNSWSLSVGNRSEFIIFKIDGNGDKKWRKNIFQSSSDADRGVATLESAAGALYILGEIIEYNDYDIAYRSSIMIFRLTTSGEIDKARMLIDYYSNEGLIYDE